MIRPVNHKFGKDAFLSLFFAGSGSYMYHKYYQLQHKSVLDLTYKNLSEKLAKATSNEKLTDPNFYSDDNEVDDPEGESL